jgi:hypothetical protein
VSVVPNTHAHTSIGEALGVLAARVALLEAERNALAAEITGLREHEIAIARKLYRRGYRTGWAAARRGAAPQTAPDRHARGWAREMLA